MNNKKKKLPPEEEEERERASGVAADGHHHRRCCSTTTTGPPPSAHRRRPPKTAASATVLRRRVLPQPRLQLLLLLTLLMPLLLAAKAMAAADGGGAAVLPTELPLCSRTFQACSAELRHYPAAATTTPEPSTPPPPPPAIQYHRHAEEETVLMVEGVAEVEDVEGSGSEEAGEEPLGGGIGPLSFPLYDELVAEQASAPFDYEADPDETARAELCACPRQGTSWSGEEEEGDLRRMACGGANNGSYQMELDRGLTLAFCQPIRELAPPCSGHRDLVRVIGTLDGDGRLVRVRDTVLFCQCNTPGYALQKIAVEPWYNGGGVVDKYALIYRCQRTRPPLLAAAAAAPDQGE